MTPQRERTSVLFELDSDDSRVGAVAELVDLAPELRSRGIGVQFAGPLGAEIVRKVSGIGCGVVRGQSRPFGRADVLAYTASVIKWKWCLHRLKPRIVYINYCGWGPSLACAAYYAGIPVIGRAVPHYSPANPLNKWASAYVANSQAHAAGLLDSPLASKVRIARTVIRFECQAEPGKHCERIPPKREGTIRVLFVGQLTARKGLSTLVKAFAGVGQPAELMLVGGDWSAPGYPQEIRALIEQAGVSDRVRCVNHRHDISCVMGTADAFVMPSMSDARPRALLEAMYSGLPVIGTRVGAIPTIIDDGINGLLVSPGDVAELRSALNRMCHSAEARLAMGVAAKQSAAPHFDIDQVVGEHLRVYRSVLADRVL